MSQKKLSVFGIGRRTVGRGPGVVAALPACPQRQTEVSPPPSIVCQLIQSLDDDVAATKRRTTSRLTL